MPWEPEQPVSQYREILKNQPVLPAPMCGISDYAQREVCRRMGAAWTFTQMVSAEGLTRDDDHTLRILDLAEGESRVAMQIFGGDPERLAAGARRLEALGAAVVDLNMGCPARKVNVVNAGAALLRDLPLAGRIFRAMRRAVSVPLTVKMRWDWDDGSGAALEVARMAEAEGFDGVTLHARTREQGYSGKADWSLIERMRAAVSMAVVGNGDVREPADALAMMRQTGCDGVMIGRALIGDPWLLAECLAAIARGEAEIGRRGPDWEERRRLMLAHAGAMVERRGPHGLVQFRKHAAAYLRGLPGAKRLREGLMNVRSLAELEAALGPDALQRAEAAALPE